METKLRHVLLINLQPSTLDTLGPFLRQQYLDLHTVEASPFVLDLIRGTPFEILIVRFPLEGLDMNSLIDAAREQGSMCRSSGFVVICEEKDLADAIPWMEHGVNRIVMLEWSRNRIWNTINELLDVAPRLEIEIPVQVALPADIARDIVLFKTANISGTGALLSGFRAIPEGTSFTFALSLPGEDHPINGAAEVVRRTGSGSSGSFGIGVRYVSIEDEKRRLLDQFIENELSRLAI